jgi:hypothetical protein
MKVTKSVVNGHQWYQNVVLQALMGLVTLLSLVLASGAGQQWW